jgi:hypothetical protein
MPDEKKTGFSGIFGGLKKMVFTEDYLGADKSDETKKAPVAAPSSFKSANTNAVPPNN